MEKYVQVLAKLSRHVCLIQECSDGKGTCEAGSTHLSSSALCQALELAPLSASSQHCLTSKLLQQAALLIGWGKFEVQVLHLLLECKLKHNRMQSLSF